MAVRQCYLYLRNPHTWKDGVCVETGPCYGVSGNTGLLYFLLALLYHSDIIIYDPYLGDFLRRCFTYAAFQFLFGVIWKLGLPKSFLCCPQDVDKMCHLHWTPLGHRCQIMACRLFGTKPLSEQILSYCQLGPQEQTWVHFKYKDEHFLPQKSVKKLVCKAVAILFRPQCDTN